MNLRFLLQVAYDKRASLILNVPAWGANDHWDVQGKVSEYDATLAKLETSEQHRTMQQELLAKLFYLRVHAETKVQPVYELVIAKDGLKMTENTVKDSDPDARKKTGTMLMRSDRLEGLGMPISNLVRSLQDVVERNVIDKTGLTGKYDLKLRWSPELEGSAAPPEDNTAPGIFQAVQEQLGLRLVPAKAPVETLVVDTAVRPTEE